MAKRIHQIISLLREQSGKSRVGSQSESRIRFILPTCGASHIINRVTTRELISVPYCNSLLADVSYFLCFMKKKDVCVTQLLIVFYDGKKCGSF